MLKCNQQKEIRVIHSLKEIQQDQWDLLNNSRNPFLYYDFLAQLEIHHCLDNQNWQPCHHLLFIEDKLVAAIPLYIKHDSYGEFVFDWAWADAYERAGGGYYPKLVSAIPFSPVIGERCLVHPEIEDEDQCRKDLLNAVFHFAEEQKISSCHILFCKEHDHKFIKSLSLLKRLTWQYHWFNRNYQNFNDYLSALNSKRRKQIRKERREVVAAGIQIEQLSGHQITNLHWQKFYRFYCSTFKRKWGEPRLTLPFFQTLSEKLADNVVLILAKREGNYIAGAFAMRSDDTLYGRHWGCTEYHPNLHFELCYYQTIDYCIEQGLAKLDAGIQGEHKIFRGFEPVRAYSLHWIKDDTFKQAIKRFLVRETEYIEQQIDLLNQHIPYKIKDTK